MSHVQSDVPDREDPHDPDARGSQRADAQKRADRLMPDDRMARIRVRAAAHDESIESGRWPTAAQLAARWNLSVTAVYEIPRELLPFKAFGRGPRPRRRYHPDGVAAFEANDAGWATPDAEAMARV
jgi:hypothetical protein